MGATNKEVFMSGSFSYRIYSLFFLILFIFCFLFLLLLYTTKTPISLSPSTSSTPLHTSDLWPCPGYTRISSPFGPRSKPTGGASSFHSGIDIPAPSGTQLISVADSTVLFTGFKGADGYTIVLQSGIFQFIYGHVSPQFIVSVGQNIGRGQKIGQVGPKIVPASPQNPYRDSKGNPTNGATTGEHLHFTIKKDNQAINPLDYLTF